MYSILGAIDRQNLHEMLELMELDMLKYQTRKIMFHLK